MRTLISLVRDLNVSNKEKVLRLLSKFPGISLTETLSFEEYFTFNSISDDFSIKLGNNISFRKYCHILAYPKSSLIIHNNVFFNNYCSINCLGSIEIGEKSIFGEGVKIYDHNHRYSFNSEGTLGVERQNFNIGFVEIGKNCWIGSNVTILNNVAIGDNVIIGANCLIYKSVPSNTIVKHREDLIISDINERQ